MTLPGKRGVDRSLKFDVDRQCMYKYAQWYLLGSCRMTAVYDTASRRRIQLVHGFVLDIVQGYEIPRQNRRMSPPCLGYTAFDFGGLHPSSGRQSHVVLGLILICAPRSHRWPIKVSSRRVETLSVDDFLNNPLCFGWRGSEFLLSKL